MLKVAVFGSRSINDAEIVKKSWESVVDKWVSNGELGKNEGIVYLHGGAQGPQQIILALYHYCECLWKPWHFINTRLEFAPILFWFRNLQIIQNADKIVVFSNSEKDSEVDRVVNYCEKRDIPFELVEIK